MNQSSTTQKSTKQQLGNSNTMQSTLADTLDNHNKASGITYPDSSVESQMMASTFTFGRQSDPNNYIPNQLGVSFAGQSEEWQFNPEYSIIQNHKTPYGGFQDSTIILDDKQPNVFHNSKVPNDNDQNQIKESAAFFENNK